MENQKNKPLNEIRSDFKPIWFNFMFDPYIKINHQFLSLLMQKGDFLKKIGEKSLIKAFVL